MKSKFKTLLMLAVVVILSAATAVAQEQGSENSRLRRPGGLLSPRRSLLRNNPSANTPSTTSLQTSSSPSGTADKKVEPGGRSIEFNQAPVEMVFKVYGELKGITVLKDPQTPSATITLQPLQGQELTDEDKIEAIETVLEMNGIHLEPYGEKFCRAIPRKDVRKDGIPLIMDPDAELRESTRVVSLVVPFHNISVEEAQKALEGFKSANGVLLVFERTNSIIITDTEANINRMREIARMIDITTPVTENVYVRQIHNAAAADIKTALEAIVQKSKEELEKDGKQPKTAAQSSAPHSPFASRLMNRNNPQPTAPVNQPSIVTSVSDADRGMIRGKVLILSDERSNKLIIVTSKSNMDFFDKVIEQLDVETTPPTLVKVYRLKYADAEDVSDMINDLIGNAPSSKSSAKSSQNAAAKTSTGGGANMTTGHTSATRQSANKRTGEPQAGELSKENTTVLADKRINGLVVMTQKELVPVVESIIEAMDIKLAQVLIETCIIEVTLGDGLNTGIDWVQNGRFHKDGYWDKQTSVGANGLPLYRYSNAGNIITREDVGSSYQDSDGKTWSRLGDALTESVWKAGELVKGGFMTGNPAFGQMMSGGGNNGSQASSLLSAEVMSNVVGSAINYVFKSDKLNLSAVIQATKTDSRTKYIASPIVMTVDNKEATIEATQERRFLSNYETSSSYYGSRPAPKYEPKDIGIKIKVTPKINPNGTVMLNVEEEYSQVGPKQSILDPDSNEVWIDTSLKRSMSADALLENMQTVILCGLTETVMEESESGIPILKDIPYIGKWLFGKVSQQEDRKELVIFMTPYVLDDGESAQIEAMRRKNALSDPRPWDDHGWSLSELADPVSKREMLRRLKEEWKKQDEERKTKLAIEKAKVERVKKLREMSKEERNEWLELHKEELEKEQQKELEEKMLDDKSQEELKKLAAEVRERKLKEAAAELGAADEAYKGENARSVKEREDAEKAEKKAEAVEAAAPAGDAAETK